MADYQKDNEHKKDTSLEELRRNSEIFHNNQSLYILYKRIQNITAALFLVTASLSELEVLKNSLRQAALAALSQASRLIEPSHLTEEILRKLAASVFELNALCGVGFWAGTISEMNTVLLQKEITKTEQSLQEIIATYKNKFLIRSALFKDVEDMELHNRDTQKELYKGQYKRQDIKDNIKDNSIPRIRKDVPVSGNRSDRRQAILKLLGEKGNLSIKDFTTVISTYSEKTIQRELLALVAEGLVRRHGERRWSTYSLAE